MAGAGTSAPGHHRVVVVVGRRAATQKYERLAARIRQLVPDTRRYHHAVAGGDVLLVLPQPYAAGAGDEVVELLGLDVG